MKKLILLLFLFITGGAFAQKHSGKSSAEFSSRPNILLINVDDLGWRDLGFMGSKYYETPHIDKLAAEGMIFTNGYAPASNCAPSRACLITGQWTPRHGIFTVGNSERGRSKDRKLIPVKNTQHLNPAAQSIFKTFKANGYYTVLAGKWHLSKKPEDFGIDKNIGGGPMGSAKSHYPPYGVPVEPRENGQRLTDAIMEQLISALDSIKDSFFVYYAPYAVHVPLQADQKFVSKYNSKNPFGHQSNAAYASMVENLDQNIGLLIDKLKANGLYEKTLIVFTSDNGGYPGATDMSPLRAGKGSYFEGGIREPFIFVWPGHIRKGSVNSYAITQLDLFPTFLSIAGITAENHLLDGDNISSLLTEDARLPERSLFWHFPIYLEAYPKNKQENRDSLFRTRPGSVIRKGSWKLHYGFEDQSIALYNLENDIAERQDLHLSNTKKTKELLEELKKWWKKTQAPIPTELNPDFELAGTTPNGTGKK